MGPVAVLALSLAVLFTCWLAAASGASTALLLAPLPPANFSGFAALFATPLELLARAAAPLALAPALAAAPAAEWVAWLKALPAAAYAWASGVVSDGPFFTLTIGPAADYPTITLESLLLAAIALAALAALKALAAALRRQPAPRAAPTRVDSSTMTPEHDLPRILPPVEPHVPAVPAPVPAPPRRAARGGGAVVPRTPEHAAEPCFLPRGPCYASGGRVYSYPERTWVAIVTGWYLRACCAPELLAPFEALSLTPGALKCQADWDAAAKRLYAAATSSSHTAVAAAYREVRAALAAAGGALPLPLAGDADELAKYDFVAGILVATNWA